MGAQCAVGRIFEMGRAAIWLNRAIGLTAVILASRRNMADHRPTVGAHPGATGFGCGTVGRAPVRSYKKQHDTPVPYMPLPQITNNNLHHTP
jgi:hypothetical protein